MYSFPNVALLSLAQDSRFFEAGLNYSAFRNIEIEGNLTDLSNTFGISGVWDGSNGLLNTVLANSKALDGVVLNGVNFGTGIMESISFAPGRDVQYKRYRATLRVLDSGNLFNLTGFYYSGIDLSNFTSLLGFSENYSFSRKPNFGYSYAHSANAQFTSGLGNLNAILAAQNLAKTLFTGSNLGAAFYSGYTNKQGKRFYTESYNLIDNACSFNESFEFDSDSGNYSVVRTNGYTLDEKGIINLTENAVIRGIENPNFEKAANALGSEIANAYDRCLTLFNFYSPANSTAPNTEPLSLRKTFDLFANHLQYDIVFTNAPSNSGLYIWDYTQTIDRRDGYVFITENGDVAGKGVNPTAAYSGAQLGYSQVSSSINNRIGNLYTSINADPYHYLSTRSESYAPYRGVIGYNYQYSSELVSGYSGIKRIEIVERGNTPVYYYNTINIFNYKQIIQDSQTSTVGSKTLGFRLYGDKPVPLTTYLAVGQNEIGLRPPSGNDPYVTECTYSYNPNDSLVELNLGWNFNTQSNKTIVP